MESRETAEGGGRAGEGGEEGDGAASAASSGVVAGVPVRVPREGLSLPSHPAGVLGGSSVHSLEERTRSHRLCYWTRRAVTSERELWSGAEQASCTWKPNVTGQGCGLRARGAMERVTLCALGTHQWPP